jgi:hypothetical protein
VSGRETRLAGLVAVAWLLPLLVATGCEGDPGRFSEARRDAQFMGCAAEDAGAESELDADVAAPMSVPDGATLASAPTGEVPQSAPAPRPKMVFMSIDGLRPDAIVKAPAVNMLRLLCKGSYSWQAQTIRPSITLPSHASMLSGFPPEVHGLYHNDLRPGFIPVPTVLAVAHAAGLRTVMVVGKEKLVQLAPDNTVDSFVWAPNGDDDVAATAIAEAKKGFDLMFVHFAFVDLTGHALMWLSDAYLRQVQATDAAVGRLLKALPEHTTVLLSADHGGHGFNHQAGVPEDLTIPWIIAGPTIRKAHAISAPISTLDTAATVAQVFGLRLRADAVGRVVQEAFDR